MKQQITLKQWNELSIREKAKFLGIKFRKLNTPSEIESDPLPNIGEMIEFLGNHVYSDIEEVNVIKWIKEKELCDCLWESVKHKLKQ